MITLKILDDKDAELELLSDDYRSVIPPKLQWRNWAADTEGITGDAMKDLLTTNFSLAYRILMFQINMKL